MKVARLLRPIVTVLSVAAAAGCAGEKRWERPKVVRASGVVRYQGKPLEGAQVTFTHTTTTISALGHTDAEGRFTLTTFELDDGAVPGKHQVAVSKVQLVGRAAASTDRAVREKTVPVRRASAPPEWRWLIPTRYGNPDTSGLTAEVPESGTTEIVLELQGSAR
jgi:hypothetical protein